MLAHIVGRREKLSDTCKIDVKKFEERTNSKVVSFDERFIYYDTDGEKGIKMELKEACKVMEG